MYDVDIYGSKSATLPVPLYSEWLDNCPMIGLFGSKLPAG